MRALVHEVASGSATVVFPVREGFRVVLQGLCCLCLFVGAVGLARAADDPSPETNGKAEPLVLDLSEFYHQPNLRLNKHYESFIGRRVMDGLPFEIGGQVRLYGQTHGCGGGQSPDTIKGIRIGRACDELHLIHHTTWPDVEGQPVAYISLNYADGTKYIFSIRYGVHVRDWFNLPSYEKESVTDPNTTICWRCSPVMFKAPVRIFKSKFMNPSPKKVVDTMDIVSARNLASYNLLAATVANRDSARAASVVGDRSFDGKLVIRVVDDATGKPIEGALVKPGMEVLGVGVVGSPFLTSSAGEGTIPYPIKDTEAVFVSVEKEGYRSSGHHWRRPLADAFTFRLSRGDVATRAE